MKTIKSNYNLKNLLKLGYSKNGKIDQTGYLLMKTYNHLVNERNQMQMVDFKAFVNVEIDIVLEDLKNWVYYMKESQK